MKVLFTGANGFLGKNVIPLLRKENFEVKTFGTSHADYVFNITNAIAPFEEKFDIVFHAAGKAHSIPQNQDEENLFYKVNFDGTKTFAMHWRKIFLNILFLLVQWLFMGKILEKI